MSSISRLVFPFDLKPDQLDAVTAWVKNNFRGTIIYSTGTGKTEIAFECARYAATLSQNNNYSVLFLVPRIVLIDQNIHRLTKYGIPRECIGVYYGSKKYITDLVISTYQSIIHNHELIRKSNIIIFDEVHLISNTATKFNSVLDIVSNDKTKHLLGLTATINENDDRYTKIFSLMPPTKRYIIVDAVKDGRLARPILIPKRVSFTIQEEKIYSSASNNIRNISQKLGTSDPKRISSLLTKGGTSAALAKLWFENVKKRKDVLNCSENKLKKALEIANNHRNEKIMIFSETISSLANLQKLMEDQNLSSMIIHNGIREKTRKEILDQWGKTYFNLLSVHTLEIGYDIPDVRIAIILANTSNVNQIAQRIGRVIRKTKDKENALIYVVSIEDSKDTINLKMIDKVVKEKSKPDDLKITYYF